GRRGGGDRDVFRANRQHAARHHGPARDGAQRAQRGLDEELAASALHDLARYQVIRADEVRHEPRERPLVEDLDRKSTRLNSSHSLPDALPISGAAAEAIATFSGRIASTQRDTTGPLGMAHSGPSAVSTRSSPPRRSMISPGTRLFVPTKSATNRVSGRS